MTLTHRDRSFSVLPTVLLCLAALSAWPAGAAPDRPPQLETFYDTWLVGVDPWIGAAERRAFLALTNDVEREVFIRRFWQARRDPDGGEEALERWQRHFEAARRRFRGLATDRAQAILLAGGPSRVLDFGGCSGPLRRIEVWVYEAEQARFLTGRDDEESIHLVFAEVSMRDPGNFQQWSPTDGAFPLMSHTVGRAEPPVEELLRAAVVRPCVAVTVAESRVLKAALTSAWSADELRRRVRVPAADPQWTRFPRIDGADLGGARLEFLFPGHYTRYTIVQGRLHVPTAAIARNADGHLFDRLVIIGDIWLGRRFQKTFKVVHHVAGPLPDGEASKVALDFYRRLRPGTYTLRLRVEDGRGLALLREDRELVVPWVESAAVAPAGYRQGFPGLLRSEVGVLTTFPSVRLLVSGDELMAGEVEVAAVTTGGPIGRLDFLLDGAAVGSDTAPPYAVSLELGHSPEAQVLEALAFAPEGREIARDRAELNVGSPRFDVRLVEPRRGRPSRQVRAEVAVPLEEVFDRLEFFLDNERFAVLEAPPFVHPLPAPERPSTIYVRAVAYLESGEEAEDLVVVDHRPLEEIDVELVELYTSVVDAQGRPMLGLAAEDFEVFEDGEPQTLERFDTVENLPINVTLLMDVSKSMRDRMWIATTSAERFFEKVLRPQDRASLLAFNHDIRLIVPFTPEVRRLRYGASGLKAWGSTRLNDSLIYAVHYFGGRRGKKALILLSDGHDVDSDFYFEQVLEYTLRSGIAAYPIGLSLEHEETRSDLTRLARETGGRFFAIGSASALDRVYRQIEQDLRSQYLLVYRPPAKGRTEFRNVEVKVARPDLRARTIHGYYP